MQYLINERLHLRAPEPEDMRVIYAWENDSAQWGDGCTLAPYSRYAIHRYIEESVSQDIYQSRQLRLMIASNNDEALYGMIDLFDFDPLHRRASVGVYVAHEYRRAGVAREALKLLCIYAFDFLQLHQLYAQVAVNNEASLSLFESEGFVRCAEFRDWVLRNDHYETIIGLQKIVSRK